MACGITVFVDIPSVETLPAGSYTLEIFLEEEETARFSAPFEIVKPESVSAEKMELDQIYPLSLETDEAKWFCNTPAETAEYNISASYSFNGSGVTGDDSDEWPDSYVELFDDALNCLAKDEEIRKG